MSAGDRYMGRKLKAMRAKTRDATTFNDMNALPTGWHENPVLTEGAKDTLFEAGLRAQMAIKTGLDRIGDPYSGGVPTAPICSTSLRKSGR